MPFLNYKPPKAVIEGGFIRPHCCYINLSRCHENDNNVLTIDWAVFLIP